MVSAQESIHFQTLALSLGADASLISSGGAQLAAANIQALLRRFLPKASQQLLFGSLIINKGKREVFVSGKAASLSTLEFQLLGSLAQRAGCVVSRDEIHKEIYNTDYNGYDRGIDLCISRIRQKIGDPPNTPRYLKTVRGVGYQFVDGN
ncbi:MAG: response regulator transcription factor [Desulforhopalus sp.]